MKFAVVPLLLASIASATPTPESNPAIPESWKRSMESNLKMIRETSAFTDIDILNFALTLEHLEDTFYRRGLKRFSAKAFEKAGYIPRTRFNIRDVSSDESIHVQTLTSALGEAAVPACNYSFGVTNVEEFMQTASILEGVGVTAYLGAAALIADPTYLTIAGSILTVESRHNAYLRDNQLPTEAPFPQPFDVPLSAMAVYTLASGFITSCPKSADLGITPFPTLTLESKKNQLKQGNFATFNIQKGTTISPKNTFAAFLAVTGPVFTTLDTSLPGQAIRVKVPKGVAGQSYVVLTSNSSSIDDKYIIAGPGIVMVQAPYAVGGFPM